ncbi:MAG: UxaA family hydrolase [Meiothermus sp.]|uniref:UxaA family hydrolase n=1 Tax=Meiothermus sp. TaxID=1955249 RepID=UPI0025F99EF7|nr:UxaA family hydrolase [Meiothermus sp.]MCS7058995.1 UxaA family hydrolase [Meiothermus sp.]MCS7195096.1 UxaA family hydrolase [Meiothermus sp.]MCX7740931.1 UxaA family hydrolase [Meiothermus sp.]MDW8091740.1 UxaA family hydrolase [Meiothermus sp.]MDW8480419.1 UxaA family hydrolase [Meiothermus sp.]
MPRKRGSLPLTGYRRPNGRVGVRNHVLILPVDDLSNAAAEGVARLIHPTVALPHPYGRLQFGKDLELTFRTLSGHGANPNVYGAVVIGIEPKWTERVASAIAKTGKPVESFSIERHGDLNVINAASRVAYRMAQDASEVKREPIEVSELVLSIKCGESDPTLGLAGNKAQGKVVDRLVDMGASVIFGETSELTGGEHLIAERCATPALKRKFLKLYNDYIAMIEAQGVDLLGSQPTEGNIRGGLSTIEEKALGNIQKTGTRPVNAVLDYAEEVAPGQGLVFMNSSSAGAEQVTLCAAGGSVLHFFTTGQGNIVGHPLIPVIKISPNPITCKTMREHIDVALPDLLVGEIGLEQAAERILEVFVRTVNGRLTAAELLRHNEFVLTKLYPSA